jgi:hypothetical protein
MVQKVVDVCGLRNDQQAKQMTISFDWLEFSFFLRDISTTATSATYFTTTTHVKSAGEGCPSRNAVRINTLMSI